MVTTITYSRLPAHGEAHLKLSDEDAGRLADLFRFLKSAWSRQLQSQGVAGEVSSLDFVRADSVFGLFHERSPIAVMTSTFFDFRSGFHAALPNFSKYPQGAIETLSDRKEPKFMTMEYLSIHPEWRYASVGQSLGLVLCLLGVFLLRETEARFLITVPRRDRGIADQLYTHGATPLFQNHWVFNSSVDGVIFEPTTETPGTVEARAALTLKKRGFLKLNRRDLNETSAAPQAEIPTLGAGERLVCRSPRWC